MNELDIIRNHFLGFHHDFFDSFRTVSTYPPYNIRKLNELQYVVELALAGFSKSDIEVEVTEGTLTIRSAVAKDDGADNDENNEKMIDILESSEGTRDVAMKLYDLFNK